jgi:hypothetical protein
VTKVYPVVETLEVLVPTEVLLTDELYLVGGLIDLVNIDGLEFALSISIDVVLDGGNSNERVLGASWILKYTNGCDHLMSLSLLSLIDIQGMESPCRSQFYLRVELASVDVHYLALLRN